MGKTTRDLMLQLAHAAGYCCIYAMLMANRKVRSGLLSEALGIHIRTLQKWKALLRTQRMGPCPSCRRPDLDRPLPAFDVDASFSYPPKRSFRP